MSRLSKRFKRQVRALVHAPQKAARQVSRVGRQVSRSVKVSTRKVARVTAPVFPYLVGGTTFIATVALGPVVGGAVGLAGTAAAGQVGAVAARDKGLHGREARHKGVILRKRSAIAAGIGFAGGAAVNIAVAASSSAPVDVTTGGTTPAVGAGPTAATSASPVLTGPGAASGVQLTAAPLAAPSSYVPPLLSAATPAQLAAAGIAPAAGVGVGGVSLATFGSVASPILALGGSLANTYLGQKAASAGAGGYYNDLARALGYGQSGSDQPGGGAGGEGGQGGGAPGAGGIDMTDLLKIGAVVGGVFLLSKVAA